MNEDVKCAFGAIVSPIYTQQETRSKKVPKGRISRPQVPIGPLIKTIPYNDDMGLIRAFDWS